MMNGQKIRPEISDGNYKKIRRLSQLPFDVGFDRCLTIVLEKFEKSQKKGRPNH